MTLQYQGKNENRDAKKQNGDGFGTSLTYDFGGSDFAISGAYTNSDRTNDQNLLARGQGDKAEAWATGLKYDANNIYLATMYSETRNMTPISGGFANKAQNFEVVAQYQFDFGLRPSLGYVQSKGKDIEGIGDEDLVKYIDLGATYYFNKNMSAFVDYKINQLDDNNKLGLSSDDIVALGMTYQF
jgi:outer membrane pore protein E